jgi:hypothetical protein
MCDIPLVTTKAKNKNVMVSKMKFTYLEFSSNSSEAVQKTDKAAKRTECSNNFKSEDG